MELWATLKITFWGLNFTFLTLKLSRQLGNSLLCNFLSLFEAHFRKITFLLFAFRSPRERRLLQCCQIQVKKINFRIAIFSLWTWTWMFPRTKRGKIDHIKVTFTWIQIFLIKLDKNFEIVGKTVSHLETFWLCSVWRQCYRECNNKLVLYEEWSLKNASKKSQLFWYYPKNAEKTTTNWQVRDTSKEK